jgi:hypothetical protein
MCAPAAKGLLELAPERELFRIRGLPREDLGARPHAGLVAGDIDAARADGAIERIAERTRATDGRNPPAVPAYIVAHALATRREEDLRIAVACEKRPGARIEAYEHCIGGARRRERDGERIDERFPQFRGQALGRGEAARAACIASERTPAAAPVVDALEIQRPRWEDDPVEREGLLQ